MKIAVRLVRRTCAAAAAVLLIAGSINGALSSPGFSRSSEDFQFGDFLAPTDLIFQGATSLYKDRVRLTPAERDKSGGLWFQTKSFVQNGFETTFRFQLTEQGGFGANGLAFVVQNNPTPQIGWSGHGMGFRSIDNALVVKFDPYHYRKKNYVKYDEIAVLSHFSHNIHTLRVQSIGSTTNLVFADGKVHTVRIAYIPGTLRVFFDDFQNPLLTVPLDLAKAVSLDQGHAWVGFTSATGQDYFNHDLLSWTFFAPENGVTAAVSSAGSPPMNSDDAFSSQRKPVYADDAGATPAAPIVRDPSFGYALPAGIALTHQIEASTDLVHWSVVTNAMLYFRDPDSTNYDQRFYRFELKKDATP